ncbi:hypothetical protein [Candidatus Thiodictyon syntrophicum]|jgi:hypothetical protein|uniref:Uncharacterized protein n=1 Tax=Candidatus Thiodictyon syntrophicum TaxID=1166950 RepID=A0A2K8UG74_9GAMM|nr:hypothetical protein [Candidatus Thiodictyon syntrophicum]AUB84555.1 hypothetical protein THSYN_28895 [Candidatus Thiodictyon syntrophicum]
MKALQFTIDKGLLTELNVGPDHNLALSANGEVCGPHSGPYGPAPVGSAVRTSDLPSSRVAGCTIKASTAPPEVQRDGHSAILRRAISGHPRDQREPTLAERYRHAYGQGGGLGPQFAGWEDQGRWPEE